MNIGTAERLRNWMRNRIQLHHEDTKTKTAGASQPLFVILMVAVGSSSRPDLRVIVSCVEIGAA
jgi:hypothetical protein